MNDIAMKNDTGYLSTLRKLWNDALKARAARQAEQARLSRYELVATLRGTLYEYNPIICYSDTYPAHAFLLENGRGQRKIDASCDAIYHSPPARAFRNGMSLADVERMSCELGFERAMPS